MSLRSLIDNFFGSRTHVEYVVDENGNHNMSIRDMDGYSFKDIVTDAKEHAIVTPALLFVSRIYAQAKFKLVDEDTEKEIKSHELLDLLNAPNSLQSKVDFLENQMFMRLAGGLCIVEKLYLKTPNVLVGFRCLDTSLINFPKKLNKNIWINKNNNSYIEYKNPETNEKEKIQLKNCMFFYDMPAGFKNPNSLEPISRLSGSKQILCNVNDSNTAKNVIIKTNGKELITTKGKNGHILTPEEKQTAERNLNSNYGLGKGRSRSLVTKASLDWKSMHVPLRDLGLDEATKADADVIFMILNIPRDLIGLSNKRSTYNNVSESYVGYIESEMQTNIDDTCNTLTKELKKEFPILKQYKLKGDYSHLPFMASSLEKRYKTVSSKALALKQLLDAGVKWEDALQECGFDKTLKQSKNENIQN